MKKLRQHPVYTTLYVTNDGDAYSSNQNGRPVSCKTKYKNLVLTKLIINFNKSNRKFISFSHERKSYRKMLSRIMMECYLQRLLTDQEMVTFKDSNYLNFVYSNMKIVSRNDFNVIIKNGLKARKKKNAQTNK
jgi:hypothetical protein